MGGSRLQQWVKYAVPGLLVPLLGIQLVQGFRGFLPAPDGLVGLLAAPGTLLGWGGVLVLGVLLSWLILGWWGRDPSGVRGLPGLVLRLMGCIALGVAVAGLFGLGGGTGGGRVGAALAGLLTDTLGGFLGVCLLVFMAVAGGLLAAAPFFDGPVDKGSKRPPPPDLAGLVPPPGIYEGSATRDPKSYPERTYDELGHEIPMTFGGRDVGPIRFRDGEEEEDDDEAERTPPAKAPVPHADALPDGVRFADAPPEEEDEEEDIEREDPDLDDPDVEEEELDDEEEDEEDSEEEGDGEDLEDEEEPEDAEDDDDPDEEEPDTPARPTEGALPLPAAPRRDEDDEEERLAPGVRWADAPPPEEVEEDDEDDIFAPRARVAALPRAAPPSPPPTPTRPPARTPPHTVEPPAPTLPFRAEIPPPLPVPGAPAPVPGRPAPGAGDSVKAAMDALRDDGGESYRRKLEGTGMFDDPETPVPDPAAETKPARKKPAASGKADKGKATAARAKAKSKAKTKAKAKAASGATRKTKSSAKAKTKSGAKAKTKAKAKPKAAPKKATPKKAAAKKAAPTKAAAKKKSAKRTSKDPAPAPATPKRKGAPADRDEMFDRAVEVALERGAASSVLLSRKLGIGYSRARALMEELVAADIIGEMTPSGARPLLISKADWKKRR